MSNAKSTRLVVFEWIYRFMGLLYKSFRDMRNPQFVDKFGEVLWFFYVLSMILLSFV